MDGGGRLETELPNSKRGSGSYSFSNCDVTHLLPKSGNDVHLSRELPAFAGLFFHMTVCWKGIPTETPT